MFVGTMELSQVISQITLWYTHLLEKISFWTGYETAIIHWSLIIGWGYLIFLFVFLPLRKWSKRAKSWLQKSLVTQIDEMIFLLAKYQHQHIDLQALGGNPHIALMRSIFAEGNCDYIKSSKMILENIRKVEQLLSQRVISEEREMAFQHDLRKFAMVKWLEMFLRVIVGIGTLGIGLIF